MFVSRLSSEKDPAEPDLTINRHHQLRQMNGRQTGVELLTNRLKFRRRFLRRQRMLMNLRAVNLDMLKPHRLIEMLETDLEVGKQLFEHFGQWALRSGGVYRNVPKVAVSCG